MPGPAESRSSPPTRWEQQVVGDRWRFYTERLDKITADGTDVDGEARFVDAMAQRGSAVLDAGCGTGRVAAALQRRGHLVIGVDKDSGLIDIARDRHPGVPFLACDLLLLTADQLRAVGGPAEFDIIALPGNVIVYLAPGSERQVLAVLAGLLRPAGRIVAGFATDRDYPPAAFTTDAEAIGLAVEHRFSTWHLDQWTDDADWAVVVLRAPGSPVSDGADAARWRPATDWASSARSEAKP